MIDQRTLFGEPEKRAEFSQYFTPPWICTKLASWVPPTATVIEPACGSGNLIDALLRRGHDPALVTGIELDQPWAEHCRARFQGLVRIITHDFLTYVPESGAYQVALTNPPFENNLHSAFVERALEVVPLVIGIFPSSIEFGIERHNTLWSRAQVVRRARLPQRVSYGGSFSASFDTVALKIQRRRWPREPDELSQVTEEVWTER